MALRVQLGRVGEGVWIHRMARRVTCMLNKDPLMCTEDTEEMGSKVRGSFD